jgi:hypothetical protein
VVVGLATEVEENEQRPKDGDEPADVGEGCEVLGVFVDFG